MSQTLKVALESTQTHDCEFTRGYWMGVAVGATVAMEPIALRVPVSLAVEWEALVGKDVVQIDHRTIRINRFGVAFVQVKVVT